MLSTKLSEQKGITGNPKAQNNMLNNQIADAILRVLYWLLAMRVMQIYNHRHCHHGVSPDTLTVCWVGTVEPRWIAIVPPVAVSNCMNWTDSCKYNVKNEPLEMSQHCIHVRVLSPNDWLRFVFTTLVLTYLLDLWKFTSWYPSYHLAMADTDSSSSSSSDSEVEMQDVHEDTDRVRTPNTIGWWNVSYSNICFFFNRPTFAPR